MRLPALLAVAALAALAGCLEIPAARVEEDTLSTRNWRENATASASTSSWGGLVRSEHRVFEHPRASDGYGGHLGVLTFRSFLEQSEEDLRDRLQEVVRAQSEAKGIVVGEDAAKGSRRNSEGRTTQWFTYSGSARTGDALFTRNSEVRIVGEVWNCREARTFVVAVGLAQVNDVRVIGGIAVPQNPDLRTWNALVADPSGSIDGARGNGLLLATLCA